MNPAGVSPWSGDWFWSLPLIAVTVVIHVFGLGLIYERVFRIQIGNRKSRLSFIGPSLIVGGAALFATILHGVEGSIWAVAYLLVGALHDVRTAMLYSLGAMTSYGHADVYLQSRWQLMGPLETLDGWILFGLTTAFLLEIIQNVWHSSERSG